MGRFLRFIGKIIIIVTLFLLAYDKFKHPNLFYKDYAHLAAQIDKIGSKVGYSLPHLDKYVHQITLYSALFDAFIGVLLLIGDGLGVPILFLRFLIPSIIYYVPWDSRLIKSYSQKISFGNTLTLVGVAAVLFATRK